MGRFSLTENDPLIDRQNAVMGAADIAGACAGPPLSTAAARLYYWLVFLS
jgi:hypothetical protein